MLGTLLAFPRARLFLSVHALARINVYCSGRRRRGSYFWTPDSVLNGEVSLSVNCLNNRLMENMQTQEEGWVFFVWYSIVGSGLRG